jgi:hypothetical protein
MRMIDSGVELDLEAVAQNIAEADVVGIFFPNLDKVLLLDTRCSQQVAPMVAVVPRERDLAARLRAVRRMRPQLPRIESITMIPWARRVDSLLTLGVWDQLLARLDDAAVTSTAACCLAELRCLERAEMRNAILGHSYESLWCRREE